MKIDSITFSTYHLEFILLSILSPVLAGIFMQYILPPYDVAFSPLARNALNGLEFWWITSIIIVTTMSFKHTVALLILPILALLVNATMVSATDTKVIILFTALGVTWMASIIYCVYDWYKWCQLRSDLRHIDQVK